MLGRGRRSERVDRVRSLGSDVCAETWEAEAFEHQTFAIRSHLFVGGRFPHSILLQLSGPARGSGGSWGSQTESGLSGALPRTTYQKSTALAQVEFK